MRVLGTAALGVLLGVLGGGLIGAGAVTASPSPEPVARNVRPIRPTPPRRLRSAPTRPVHGIDAEPEQPPMPDQVAAWPATAAGISAALEEQSGSLARCAPPMSIEVVADFYVEAEAGEGVVSDVQLTAGQALPDDFVDCVATVIEDLQLDAPELATVMRHPIRFSASDAD